MLGIVVAAVKYYDTGAGVYLILAAISAALMTATKETWIINAPGAFDRTDYDERLLLAPEEDDCRQR